MFFSTYRCCQKTNIAPFCSTVPRSVPSLLHVGHKVLFGTHWGSALFRYRAPQLPGEQCTRCQHNQCCPDAEQQEEEEENGKLQAADTLKCTKSINLPHMKSFIQERNWPQRGNAPLCLDLSHSNDADWKTNKKNNKTNKTPSNIPSLTLKQNTTTKKI